MAAPLLNKRFLAMARAVKSLGIAKVKTVTNGMFLRGDVVPAIIRSGLDEIEISLDGDSGAQSDQTRRRAPFERICAKDARFSPSPMLTTAISGRDCKMEVAVLSPHEERLASAFEDCGDRWKAFDDVPDRTDFAVSFGHRKIIREPVISQFAGRLINIHISILPWNRGADPNFWSWFDRTPKGVTIHHIDAGIDTGRIISQRHVIFGNAETLASSYEKLMEAAVALFREAWPVIRSGAETGQAQKGVGSYHRVVHKTELIKHFPLGYATPVREIEALGDKLREP